MSFLPVFSQDSKNYIDVVANATLAFTVNSVVKTEGTQTISGALSVTFRNEGKTREVYARISSVTAPSGFTPTSPYPIQVDYTSDNSTNESNLITAPLQLTSTDQRLFTQVKKTNTLFSFNYDLILMATNWAYPPGSYVFTITFTLTPP
jgi:hypothetical protein